MEIYDGQAFNTFQQLYDTVTRNLPRRRSWRYSDSPGRWDCVGCFNLPEVQDCVATITAKEEDGLWYVLADP